MKKNSQILVKLTRLMMSDLEICKLMKHFEKNDLCSACKIRICGGHSNYYHKKLVRAPSQPSLTHKKINFLQKLFLDF
jgi:hypothetical protein